MIARWDPVEHLPMLGEWLRARDIAMDAGTPDLYPRVGFVVNGIAVGFLYQTDAPAVAWLDGVVTDPASLPDARAAALRELVEALYAEASKLGCRLVWSTTSAPSLVELGQACGAKVMQRNHVCLYRDLR